MIKMHKPDCCFEITVCPIYKVYPCSKRTEEESRGLMGFHLSRECPDCKTVFSGYEFWGSNGHLQGNAPDREHMIHWIKVNALRQRIQYDGRLQGNRFYQGQPIYYLGQ